jgi:hypothetical protein
MTLGELLRPRELSVVQNVIHSRQAYGIENYLCSSGQTKSAERLIERGFLTKVDRIGLGEPWGLVVTITNDNIAAINAALGNPVQ